jgi:putative ATP-dependent endonuclease of OLD family
MIIKTIRVRNFRSIKDETLDCGSLTALVGPNGSGKSSFLRAIDIFYTTAAKYTEEDFYGRNTTQPIIITVAFTCLSEDEKLLFRKYTENGELTVEKELKWPASRTSQKYHGNSLQNPEFEQFYRSQSARERKSKYENLLGSVKYSSLPRYTNQDDATRALRDWEQAHPDGCVLVRDDGQFFGFKEVGESHLERSTRFVFVPAVRDAAQDAAEGKGSILSDIMDMVVRSVLAQSEDVMSLQRDTQLRYDQIMEPAKLPQLRSLANNLGNILKRYVPDADVDLSWLKSRGVEIPMPLAEIRLVEDAYTSEVGHTGHGLQRAFILALLEFLATVRASTNENARTQATSELPARGEDTQTQPEVQNRIPDLILGIEEPELYQHPSRQRYLSSVLLKLASGTVELVGRRTQVIYATHSPLMVDLERFDQLRIFRKNEVIKGQPKLTRIARTTLDEVARTLEKAYNKPQGAYTGQALKPRLQALMTPWMNEGFFSKVAVLVEGEEDRAALLGLAAALGHDFERLEISVIPCMGKSNIDRPTIIFRNLGIPVYAIWDSDFGHTDANPEDNCNLLRLFGEPIEDWPEMITDRFACFKTSLTEKFQTEIGEAVFSEILRECGERFHITKKKHAIKNPWVIHEFFKESLQKGKKSPTLETIISRIVTLRQTSGLDSNQ